MSFSHIFSFFLAASLLFDVFATDMRDELDVSQPRPSLTQPLQIEPVRRVRPSNAVLIRDASMFVGFSALTVTGYSCYTPQDMKDSLLMAGGWTIVTFGSGWKLADSLIARFRN